jgi:hypothetical protein
MKADIEHNPIHNNLLSMTFQENEIEDFVNSVALLIKNVYNVSIVRKTKVEVKFFVKRKISATIN